MKSQRYLLIVFLIIFSLKIPAQSKIQILENHEKKAKEYEIEGKCRESLNYNYSIIKIDSLSFKEIHRI